MLARPGYRRRPVKRARKIVNKICTALRKEPFQHSVGIKASEIFVGGSLGQGTVVAGHYDIDMVLYSTSLHPSKMDVVETGYDNILTKLNKYLKEKIADYTFLNKNDYALKFRVADLDVDLLLSPLWASQIEVFQYLQRVQPPLKRRMFSSSMSKYQVELIKSTPQKARVLIARFKAWRNNVWNHSTDGRPKSYALSLLVIMAYEHAPKAFKQRRKIKAVAEWVTNELKRVVKMVQREDDLDLMIPGADETILRKYRDLLPPKPRIIDPVNPSNNVFLSGVGPITRGGYKNKWDIFAREIELLDLALPEPCVTLLRVPFIP